jgi:hypothetical protein
MGKRIALIFALLTVVQASGQYDSEGANKSRFRPGMFWFYTGFRPAKSVKSEQIIKYDRVIADITYNDWMGDRAPFQNHWASIGVNTSIMFDIPMTRIYNTASFGIGISHEYTDIRHNGKFIADPVLETTTWMPKDSSDIFTRSSLVGNSFSIPIEFRFRTKSWKHFKVHIGGKIGYQAYLAAKSVMRIDGDKSVLRDHGFQDESRLLYSAHIRIGVRNWAVYTAYYFNPIFLQGGSTKLNRVQFGVSLSLF